MQIANANPAIRVTGRHISVTEAMKDYAIKKVESVHLDYPKIIEAHVILSVEKYRQRAEVVLHCANHITIEASEEGEDMYASIDKVISKIAQQMRKYKTRLMRHHRPRRHEVIYEIDEQVLNADGFDEFEEKEPAIIHTEKYPVKPMYIDEAILQMEMSTRQFVVFLNAKSEKVNVLYRRKDGEFGVIDPTFG